MDMIELPAKLKDLRWYKLRADLVSIANHRRSWLSIFEGIIKAVTIKTVGTYNLKHLRNPNTILFHLVNKNFNTKLLEGSNCELEIIFTSFKEKELSFWRDIFIKHIHEEVNEIFTLKSVSDIQERDITKLLQQYQDLPHEGELCLNFLTPLAFSPPADRDRTFLPKDQFIHLINKRLYMLFNIDISYTEDSDNWSLLPYYWHYSEVRHLSLSQPGRIKYINGCTGKLYLKGKFKKLLPYLILEEELHTGTKITYGRGYYRLHLEGISAYPTFPDKKEITTVIIETLNKNDLFLPDNLDEKKLATEISEALKDTNYIPSPANAFKGDNNIVYEKYNIKDFLIQQYLLRLLEKPLNRALQPTAIGYRKGKSQKDIGELINRAIKNGYEYIALFELKSYYNAIQHGTLIKILQELLPQKDHYLADLISKYLKIGYILSGTYHPRTQGLSSGSPLSSLLANIYLHSLDEELNKDAICPRYADKFLLLTKTPEALEENLLRAEELLRILAFSIDKEKLHKHHISEGFKYCGITYDCRTFQEAIYKKPLYVTEQDIYLGTSANALELRKGGKIINTIPFHRISEIIITARASFSTSFIEKALKNEIPITVQLHSGYNMTTIKPDIKESYEVSYLHTRVYTELQETDILDIARLIVTSKLRSYIELFNKRYEKKDTSITTYLEETIFKLEEVSTLNELRGYEALAARRCFKELNNFINNKAFNIKARVRRPADRINSLLNFGYYSLFSKINATVRALGLNPYLGFLHEPSNKYETLVADMQELFRARIDNFIIKLINLQIITEEDFKETTKGYRLDHAGIKKFIHHFETEMDRKYASDTLTFEETIYEQVLQIKKWVLEDEDLFFYVVVP